jgi:hypothetical protein
MLAHAYHQAETSGSPVDGLEQPKSIGYGIGLAVGLFAMEFVGALFEYQSAQIAAVQGCCLRAAVSPQLPWLRILMIPGSRPDFKEVNVRFVSQMLVQADFKGDYPGKQDKR